VPNITSTCDLPHARVGGWQIEPGIELPPDKSDCMEIDEPKVDEISLALLYLTTFRDKFGFRAWESHSWDVLDRLHEDGYIDDPRSKAKSVLLTDEGVERSKALFEKHFAKQSQEPETQLTADRSPIPRTRFFERYRLITAVEDLTWRSIIHMLKLFGSAAATEMRVPACTLGTSVIC
jgi:hypothetical protein